MSATQTRETMVFHSMAQWREHYGVPERKGPPPLLPGEEDPRNLSVPRVMQKLLKELGASP